MKKLNRFNKSNKKRNFIVIGVFPLTGIILVGISYAVYQRVDEIKFINAKVGEFETSSSDIELAMTLDGETINVPPNKSDGYYNITVECDNADGKWNMEEWGADIRNITSNRVKCNIDFETIKSRPLSVVELGDYIRMTPTATSYTIPSSLTGHSSNQTINPSELNLWRVIRKNEDGTVDVVSEYVSSALIIFTSQTGYLNLVGGLNTIASQYKNDKYVEKTRHMGYSNQIEYCSSLSSCSDDNGYTIDTNLVQKAIGNLLGKKPNGEATSYAIPSRFNDPSPSVGSQYRGRMVTTEGQVLKTGYFFRPYDSTHYGLYSSIRPILILKKDVELIYGDGKTIDTAFQLN